ncbi:hypothetical protein ACKC9G_00215 [Pokkaliibacter sp. CJK22405]|uniref:hypothetical protein n=1 Tax=Pokkaliibacter sp. CJK22405 TaxID=3384615 RepID=UPI003984AB4B
MNISRFKPDFNSRIYWYAMDENGHIALMENFGWGDIPYSLQKLQDWLQGLDDLNEYINEELTPYKPYPNKNGGFELDIYGSVIYSYKKPGGKSYKTFSRDEVVRDLLETYSINPKNSPLSAATRKGIFTYRGVEGYKEGDDTPVGFDGEFKMGDYYRFLRPTEYLKISELPAPLRQYVCISNSIDFNKDRLIESQHIDSYFPNTYRPSSED